jgi:hypothetical protein
MYIVKYFWEDPRGWKQPKPNYAEKFTAHKKKSLHFQMSVNIFLNDANDCKMFDALILKMQTKKKKLEACDVCNARSSTYTW